MDWTSYHRLDDIYGYLSYLADRYPCRVQLLNVGSSYEGRPLYVVHITNSTSPDTPAIWIDGGKTFLESNPFFIRTVLKMQCVLFFKDFMPENGYRQR